MVGYFNSWVSRREEVAWTPNLCAASSPAGSSAPPRSPSLRGCLRHAARRQQPFGQSCRSEELQAASSSSFYIHYIFIYICIFCFLIRLVISCIYPMPLLVAAAFPHACLSFVSSSALSPHVQVVAHHHHSPTPLFVRAGDLPKPLDSTGRAEESRSRRLQRFDLDFRLVCISDGLSFVEALHRTKTDRDTASKADLAR